VIGFAVSLGGDSYEGPDVIVVPEEVVTIRPRRNQKQNLRFIRDERAIAPGRSVQTLARPLVARVTNPEPPPALHDILELFVAPVVVEVPYVEPEIPARATLGQARSALQARCVAVSASACASIRPRAVAPAPETRSVTTTAGIQTRAPHLRLTMQVHEPDDVWAEQVDDDEDLWATMLELID
jgi:hypothetical protein